MANKCILSHALATGRVPVESSPVLEQITNKAVRNVAERRGARPNPRAGLKGGVKLDSGAAAGREHMNRPK